MDNLSKLVLTRTGMMVIATISFYLVFILASGQPDNLVTIAGSLVGGVLVGSSFYNRLRKQQGYLLDKVQRGERSTAFHYKRLFKQGELPAKKSEYSDYLEYLNTIEGTFRRNIKPSTLWFIAFIVLLNVYLWPKNGGVSGINVLGVALFVMLVGVYVRSKRTLPKIERLKSKITYGSKD